MKVLMITGGNIDNDFAFSFIKNKKYDEVIAVDGGLAFADRAGLVITHLVGDFDTIDEKILEKYYKICYDISIINKKAYIMESEE